MPRDEWLRANNRAKYGPAPYAKQRKLRKPKRSKPPKHRKTKRAKRRLAFTPGEDPCPKCGSYEIDRRLQIIKDGRQQIRVSCKQCRKFLKWDAHDSLFLEHANG